MVEGGGGGDRKTPLLPKLPRDSDESEEEVVRTGTLWTVIAHVITAVIGSGVLSLAWSVAQLGWIAGPLALVIFAAVTVTQSSLLADCYRSPDPEYGHIRNHSYLQAVKLYLGGKSVWFCGFFQKTSLYGCAIAYTITSATSMSIVFVQRAAHVGPFLPRSLYYYIQPRL